ncbi:MAG TPA: D-ribose pyranase [Ktedonobacteraceae bacterium]
MNKQGILHPELAQWVAKLGHHNYLLITDAGYPHLDGIPHIDLGFTPGIPSFIDVLRSIVAELPMEKVWLATEFPEENPAVYKEFLSLIPEDKVRFVGDHEQLKKKSREALVVVRTGEFTPYANCLIECGVAF